jgi:hypothetical protein
MKKLYCLIAIIGLFIVFTAPLAHAQHLNGEWFQVTFSAKGYLAGNNYFAVGDQVSVKTVNYLQFVYNDLWSTACPAGYTPQFYPFYEIHVWYPVGAGWEYYVSDYVGPYADHCFGILCPYKEDWVVSEKTFLDKQFVTIGHGDWLRFGVGGVPESGGADAVTILDIKRQGSSIKSATFKSYGCASEFSTGAGGALGSCTIKGKLIKPEKLPSGIPPAGVGPEFTTVDLCAPPP